jgi:hypothetical protein
MNKHDKNTEADKQNRPQSTPQADAGRAEGRQELVAGTTLTPKKLAKGWSLINGEERNRLHPDTFEIPSKSRRRNVEPGLLVVIGLANAKHGGERFWVKVVSKGGTPENCTFIGEVRNPLIYSFAHSVHEDELIVFRQENILTIRDPE